MKKIVALLLVFVIALSLCACGGSGGSTRTCKFKEGGRYVCSSPCKSGSNFCSYHNKYLNDAYNSFVFFQSIQLWTILIYSILF